MPGILILKLGALGDIVMACPLIRRIQEHHAPQETWLMTADPCPGFLADWEGLRVRAFPRRGWRAARDALRWIRAGAFERIYDLQSSDRTGVLCALSGVPERVGNHPRFPYTLHPPQPWRGETHIHERWRAVLESAGIAPGPLLPWLPVSVEDRQAVDAWLRGNALAEGFFAALHAGTSVGRIDKRWPHFGELAAVLRGAGLGVVWLGGPDDRELNRDLRARFGGVDATCAFSLPRLAALGGRARFAVTNDSAPMHALACAGMPVFGLFGPTDWRRNHAIGQAGNVISAADCAADWTPAAMDALPLARVVERLRQQRLLG
jgi:ADP-heptose:LPS heptosyltransferase